MIIEKRNHQLKKNASIILSWRQLVEAFSWLIIDGGGYYSQWNPWAACLGVYKNRNWVRQGKQALHGLHSSMASATAPSYRSLPCLSACLGFPQWCTVVRTCKPCKPFSLQVASTHGLYHSHTFRSFTCIRGQLRWHFPYWASLGHLSTYVMLKPSFTPEGQAQFHRDGADRGQRAVVVPLREMLF